MLLASATNEHPPVEETVLEAAAMMLFFALFGVATVVVFSPLWVPFAIRGRRQRRQRRDALIACGGVVRGGAVVFRVRHHEVVVRPDPLLSFTVAGLTPEVGTSIYLCPLFNNAYRRQQYLANGPWLSEGMYASLRPHIRVAALGTTATDDVELGIRPHAFSFSPAKTRALLDDADVATALLTCPGLRWASFRNGTLRVVLDTPYKQDLTPLFPTMLANVTTIIDAVDRTRGERAHRLRAHAS